MRAVLQTFILAKFLTNFVESDMRTSLQNVPEIHFSISKNWYGTPRYGPAYNFTIHKETNGEVPVTLDAPFYNEPQPPRSTRMGGFLGLLNFEAFEMLFLGDDNECLHIAVGPGGHYIILLLHNEHLSIKDDLRMAYDSKISYSPPYWKATIKIPLAYFPKNTRLFNAAARHGTGDRRSMDVLYIDDQPLSSYFSSPPYRTFRPINMDKIFINFDNSQQSEVWKKAVDEYRNAPRDSSSLRQASLTGEMVVGIILAIYTLSYLAFIKFI